MSIYDLSCAEVLTLAGLCLAAAPAARAQSADPAPASDQLTQARADVSQIRGAHRSVATMFGGGAPPELAPCLGGKLSALTALNTVASQAGAAVERALLDGDGDRAAHESRKLAVASTKALQLQREALACQPIYTASQPFVWPPGFLPRAFVGPAFSLNPAASAQADPAWSMVAGLGVDVAAYRWWTDFELDVEWAPQRFLTSEHAALSELRLGEGALDVWFFSGDRLSPRLGFDASGERAPWVSAVAPRDVVWLGRAGATAGVDARVTWVADLSLSGGAELTRVEGLLAGGRENQRLVYGPEASFRSRVVYWLWVSAGAELQQIRWRDPGHLYQGGDYTTWGGIQLDTPDGQRRAASLEAEIEMPFRARLFTEAGWTDLRYEGADPGWAGPTGGARLLWSSYEGRFFEIGARRVVEDTWAASFVRSDRASFAAGGRVTRFLDAELIGGWWVEYYGGDEDRTDDVWRADVELRWMILHPLFLGAEAGWEDRRSRDGLGLDYRAADAAVTVELAI